MSCIFNTFLGLKNLQVLAPRNENNHTFFQKISKMTGFTHPRLFVVNSALHRKLNTYKRY